MLLYLQHINTFEPLKKVDMCFISVILPIFGYSR